MQIEIILLGIYLGRFKGDEELHVEIDLWAAKGKIVFCMKSGGEVALRWDMNLAGEYGRVGFKKWGFVVAKAG